MSLESIEELEVKRAFDKIAAGLDDAIAYAGGDTSRGREAKSVDVRAIRMSMKKRTLS